MIEGTDSIGSESRRSFVKKGALAGSALALGASGSAAAQTDGGTETPADGEDGEIDAVIQTSNYHPQGRFIFVSGVVDWTPNFPEVADDVWTSYNTYMIRWLNTNEIVPIWVEGGATLEGFEGHLGYIPADDDDSDRPELYEMEAGTDDFEQSENVVRVAIDEVPREPAEVILGTDEWWQDGAEDGETPTATPGTGTAAGNESGS